MRKISLFTVGLLFLTVWNTPRAYAQANGSLGGTVQDTTKALIPGVSITLTNLETGVADTRITNDSGSYSFPSVQAGTYKLTGDLTGFRQAVNPNVQVGTAAQVRVDLIMQIGNKGDAVTVKIDDVPLTVHETSSSVGEVLEADRIRTLPIVGGNVLDLLTVLPGFRESQFGAPFDTVGGLGLNSVNATVNGMSTNSSLNSPEVYGYQVFTPMVLSPDLVGEIRLILAPVDAELGRGNAQVQIQTRSGTNKYSGSGVWNIQNSALNANTWINNHVPTIFNGVQVSNNTVPNWKNINQITASFGGPIIKNKTFFFFLYDKNMNASRSQVYTTVLTPEAHQGIFRYFAGFNPLNAAGAPVFATNGTTGNTGAAAYPSVDAFGNPTPPPIAPGGSLTNPIPYVPPTPNTTGLMCFSVYGNVLANGTPFSQANCPGGTAVVHSAWDPARASADSTGYINKVLSLMPLPNNFSSSANGDGLNTAAFQYLRGSKKTQSNQVLYATSGSNYSVPGFYQGSGNGDYNNRWQSNIKIDHNINQKNRVSGQLSYQSDSAAGLLAEWPDGFSGQTSRRAYILTINGTSTISANLVNEGRFGGNYTKQRTNPPWASTLSPEYQQAAYDFSILPGGITPQGKVLPIAYNPQAPAGGFRSAGNTDQSNTNPLWDFADTLRWTHGKHSFSFGGEYRRPITTGYAANIVGFSVQNYPTVFAGGITGGPATMTPPMSLLTNFNGTNGAGAELPGFLQTARNNAVNLNYLLYGAVGFGANLPTQNFWVTSYEDLKNGTWQDTTTSVDKQPAGDPAHGHLERTQISNEWSFFGKDDFKITKRLTLNLGLRWDMNMAPYYTGGLTNNLKDDGAGLYGPARPASGDLLQNWFSPGSLYLSGYGSTAALAGGNPLSCELGKQQNPNLPVSTCDPNLLSQVQFIGPGTPNPDLTINPQKGQFSPAIGFAYQIPWFGEGKTSIRGGWQRTYGGASSQITGVGPATGLGGDTFARTVTVADSYVDSVMQSGRAPNLTDLANILPRYPARGPGQANMPIANGTANTSAGLYDSDFRLSYTDNLTLSLSRNWSRKVTMDIRVVDTIGRGLVGGQNLNQYNVFNNPEVVHALDVTRAGGNDPLFDTMLLGLNLVGATSANYGRVGTVTNVVVTTVVNGVTSTLSTTPTLQRGSAQVRRLQAANLANGNYVGVMTGLIATAVSTASGNPGAAGGGQLLPIDPSTNATYTGAAQRVLRNGCDRIANGVTTGFTTPEGDVIAPRCFPENYLITNPQFGGTATLNKNYGHSNYTSGQLQFTVRPVQGVTVQGTYSLSKTMSLPSSGYTHPLYRDLDYGSAGATGQEIRANGTVELPIGPNKLVAGNTSGLVARVIEKWQTSFTFTLPQGSIRSMVGSNMLYANGRPDIVGPWNNPEGEVTWSDHPINGNVGNYYADRPFLTLPDPQCSSPAVATTDANNFNLRGNCTLLELGQVVDASTPGAVQRTDGKYVLPMLANPLPGHQGNLGKNTMRAPAHLTLNASASKNFRITESKSLQIRIDTTNVLNHPWAPDPNGLDAIFNSLSDNFGVIAGKGANNNPRTFQGQLRFSF